MPSPLLNNGVGYRGFQEPYTGASQYNTLSFIVKSLMNRMGTISEVQVQAVTNTGDLSPVGYVDVQPLVRLVDGAGNTFPHGNIQRCPYVRIQGGLNAIILDPVPGDIGLAFFASNDVSKVDANRAAIWGKTGDNSVPPGSSRRYDMSDGLYLGGVLNGLPTQFVQFSASGIRIHAEVLLQLDAPNILIRATDSIAMQATNSMTIDTPLLTITGNVATIGTLTNNMVDVGSLHLHSGVSTGIHDTGPPIP